MQLSTQKMRLRSSCQTLCRNTWRRRWRSETVASNSSHFESHAVSKHVATTLTSGAPGRKNVETTAAIGVPRIFSGVGGSGRRPVNPPTPEGKRRVGVTEGANIKKVLGLLATTQRRRNVSGLAIQGEPSLRPFPKDFPALIKESFHDCLSPDTTDGPYGMMPIDDDDGFSSRRRKIIIRSSYPHRV